MKDDLATLNALLELTKEAEERASRVDKSEQLGLLILELKGKARDEHKRLKQHRQVESNYELCMIGILEELTFGKASWRDSVGLDSRLARIHADIDRTIEETKSRRPDKVAMR